MARVTDDDVWDALNSSWQPTLDIMKQLRQKTGSQHSPSIGWLYVILDRFEEEDLAESKQELPKDPKILNARGGRPWRMWRRKPGVIRQQSRTERKQRKLTLSPTPA